LIHTAGKYGACLVHPTEIVIPHLSNRLRGVEDLRPCVDPGLQYPGKIRGLTQILESWSLALAAKPAHTLGHVGLKTHTWLFTVVANIDTRLKLFLDDVPDSHFCLPFKLHRVDGLTLLLTDQQFGEG
jgi:hypothetical protein